MPLTRVKIENYKSIKYCNLTIKELNAFIGENGSGKTSVIAAIKYYFMNLTDSNTNIDVFDINNHYSNQMKITLFFDLSSFDAISKSHSGSIPDILEELGESHAKYRSYYKTIIALVSKQENKTIQVTLSQIKGSGLKWNHTYDVRAVLKSLFPMFFLDTRNLDISEWNHLWDVISELCKVSNDERLQIQSNIKSVLDDKQHGISKKLEKIASLFQLSDVDIKKSTSKEFARDLIKISLSGDSVMQQGNQLSYFSAGTNSVKYLELLLRFINQISLTKLKEPVILIDEPEIGLHHEYIDELAVTLEGVSTKLRIIMATHSPRLVKNLIIGSDPKILVIYKVVLNMKYTQVQRMKLFPQYSPASQYVVTDNHVNSYFSRAILFVEGESELEFFSNPYLKILFPELRSIDVFQALSNQPILNIMHPDRTHLKTPYTCLIDMDKAVDYNIANGKLSLKKPYFDQSIFSAENNLYRSKLQINESLINQHKRIVAMANKLRLHHYKPYYSTNDANYSDFCQAIHDYLLHYNTYTFNTTIEGALVTKHSYDSALDFWKKSKRITSDVSDFSILLDSLLETDRINVLRLAYNGKSDLWVTRKSLLKDDREGIENFIPIDAHTKGVIQAASIGVKASGWITAYINAFFKKYSSPDDELSIKTFRLYIDIGNNREILKWIFQSNFPEISFLMNRICDMISK